MEKHILCSHLLRTLSLTAHMARSLTSEVEGRSMNSVSPQEVHPSSGTRTYRDGGLIPQLPENVLPDADAVSPRMIGWTQEADLEFSQALCARMCHDLLGPAGAINMGLEFLGDDTSTDEEALELVAASARQLKARLLFFRVAFGPSGGRGTVSLSEAQAIANGFLGTGRVALRWTGMTETDGDDAPACFSDFVRLVLCLAMVSTESLPRGGELVIDLKRNDNHSFARLKAFGAGLRVSDEAMRVLGTADADGPTARRYHIHYARQLASKLGARVRLDNPDDAQFIIDVDLADPEVPANFASDER